MATKKTREMPHSIEAEQAILCCLLIDVKVQVEISAFLEKEDFYAESHQYIFSAMDVIIKDNKPVDFVSLTDYLEKSAELERVGGIDYIAEIANVIPSTANYHTYLDIVKRDSMLRKLIRGGTKIIEESYSSLDSDRALADAEKIIFDISNSADTSEMVKINAVLPAVMNRLDQLARDKSAFHGTKTGFIGLDALLNGLHGSDLIVLAARPGVGKTSFAMNVVEAVAKQGKTCVVFSLEMSREQLVQRMLCSVASVSMENALKGQMSKKEWIKIAKAKEILATQNIFIEATSGITPEQALSKCRRIKKKYGLDFVMVDYIQLMSSGKKNEENRQQEISKISRTLKTIAMELDVPVLALSQLSRAVETRKGRPQLADLRESGAIEQDADIVMFIHRPDKNATEKEIAEGKIQQNVAEIIVEKHRNGPQGIVKLYFKGECTTFLNLNDETGEPIVEEKTSKPADVKGMGEDLPKKISKEDDLDDDEKRAEVVEKEIRKKEGYEEAGEDEEIDKKEQGSSLDDELFG